MERWRCGEFWVCGPFKDPQTGRYTAGSADDQRKLAEELGGRLPTAREFVEIWVAACVRVPFRPRNVATAPLDAHHEDIERAKAQRGEDTVRVAGGKTFTDRSGARPYNFGALVPKVETYIATSGPLKGRRCWGGMRVYPTHRPEVWAIQPEADAHVWGHGDYSQWLYVVFDDDPGELGESSSETEQPDTPRPSPSRYNQRGELVEAWQRYLIGFFASREIDALPRYGPDGHHGRETEEWTQRWRLLTQGADDGAQSDSGALPMAPFKQAKSCYRGRKKGDPIWIVIHTAEALEHSRTAENLQGWAASGPIGVSWHYAIDDDTIAPSVQEAHTAWAAPGANARGIQIELAGYARQTAEEWADEFSTKQLELCARLCAQICKRWRIPAAKVGPIEMGEGKPGICGHLDVTRGVGKGRTNHGDPGKYFPWSKFVARVRELTGEAAA